MKRLLETIASIPQFKTLFGPFKTFDDANQRWACYARFDWSLAQLPAINVYEADPEQKTSDNAWLDGSVRIMVFWPALMRRPDLQQIPVLFKGALQNFFGSRYTDALLDPYPTLNLATKVPALNRLGMEMTWSPQVEGNVAGETVPVTILDVKYRIDLRRWQDYLESQDRTQADPFTVSLENWTRLQGEYDGAANGEAQGAAKVLDGFNIPDVP